MGTRLHIGGALAGALLGLACDDDDDRCGPSSAVVARAIDGDTVVLDDGTHVRYLLVDAPELGGRTPACWGPEAREFNAALVEGRRVSLSYDVECEDAYGRLLAYVSIDERELDALMVERGFACVLFIPPNGTGHIEALEQLEATARDGRVGLWGACAEVSCD